MVEMRFWNTPRVLFFAIILLLAGMLASGYFFLNQPVTTVILVRHAEKNVEPGNNNPSLSPAGQARAQELTHVLSSMGISAIYATQYLRTQQTAQPIANQLGLPVNQIDSGNTTELIRRIRSNHRGAVVFVVGHNNTVPAAIAGLGGGNLPMIPETEYDNLFVVTVSRFGKAKVVKLKYGSQIPATGDQQLRNK
jgi:broad specificity phosphatase PhoE